VVRASPRSARGVICSAAHGAQGVRQAHQVGAGLLPGVRPGPGQAVRRTGRARLAHVQGSPRTADAHPALPHRRGPQTLRMNVRSRGRLRARRPRARIKPR